MRKKQDSREGDHHGRHVASPLARGGQDAGGGSSSSTKNFPLEDSGEYGRASPEVEEFPPRRFNLLVRLKGALHVEPSERAAQRPRAAARVTHEGARKMPKGAFGQPKVTPL